MTNPTIRRELLIEATNTGWLVSTLWTWNGIDYSTLSRTHVDAWPAAIVARVADRDDFRIRVSASAARVAQTY